VQKTQRKKKRNKTKIKQSISKNRQLKQELNLKVLTPRKNLMKPKSNSKDFLREPDSLTPLKAMKK
jgi:hypothetical protein